MDPAWAPGPVATLGQQAQTWVYPDPCPQFLSPLQWAGDPHACRGQPQPWAPGWGRCHCSGVEPDCCRPCEGQSQGLNPTLSGVPELKDCRKTGRGVQVHPDLGYSKSGRISSQETGKQVPGWVQTTWQYPVPGQTRSSPASGSMHGQCWSGACSCLPQLPPRVGPGADTHFPLQAETRAEFAERSVAKLEKTIDDLEGNAPLMSRAVPGSQTPGMCPVYLTHACSQGPGRGQGAEGCQAGEEGLPRP